MDRSRILLVDDHQLVIDGLRGFIDDLNTVEVIGEANNGQDAISYTSVLSPDLILMDVDMPVLSGIQATQEIKKVHSDVKIIIISMHNEKGLIKKLISFGADGYLLKNSPKNEVLDAIKLVLNGGKYFSEDVLQSLESNQKSSQNDSVYNQLTEREIEIIRLIAEGLTNKQIGEKLFISHRTVDTHRTNLMKKLDTSNVAGLIRFAFKNNIIQ